MMWLSKHVIPECYVDTCLINVLLQYEKEGVNHTKGNATVVAKIKNKFENLYCIGVIDKDRRDINVIDKECIWIQLGETDSYFKFFIRRGKPHYFIQMVPAIEQWILTVSTDLEIDLLKSSIACNDLWKLKKISKTVDSKTDIRFVTLFKDIVRKAEAVNYKPIITLREIIKYILEKQYKISDNDFYKWQTK